MDVFPRKILEVIFTNRIDRLSAPTCTHGSERDLHIVEREIPIY